MLCKLIWVMKWAYADWARNMKLCWGWNKNEVCFWLLLSATSAFKSPQPFTRDFLQSQPSDNYAFFYKSRLQLFNSEYDAYGSCPAKSSQKAKDRSNIMAPLTTQQLRKKQEGYINTQGNLSYHSMRRQRETVDQRNPRPRFAIGTVGASTIILSLYSCCPLGSLNPFLPSSIWGAAAFLLSRRSRSACSLRAS